MNIKCRAVGCEELSNKMYCAPVYDMEFAVPLCTNHAGEFKLVEEIPNIVFEGDTWKVICYACLLKWTPRTFKFKKTWTTGTMKGQTYGDLPKKCMACRSNNWNKPHVSDKQTEIIGEYLMKSRVTP